MPPKNKTTGAPMATAKPAKKKLSAQYLDQLSDPRSRSLYRSTAVPEIGDALLRASKDAATKERAMANARAREENQMRTKAFQAAIDKRMKSRGR